MFFVATRWFFLEAFQLSIYYSCITFNALGCDRGFGETLATRLATDGYTVYAACLDRNSEGARALGTNPNITVLQINVTKQSDVDAAARQLNQDLWERGK